jgi:hypothetical protein
MTTAASRTRVRSAQDGRLTAMCSDCAAEFVLAPGADVAGALLALDAAHPAREHPARAHPGPRGWVAVSPAVGTWGR